MSAGERPVSALPAWLPWGLALALLAQVLLALAPGARPRNASDLPPSPSGPALRAAAFGEPAALSRLAMLWLQSFDSGSTNETAYRDLDYGRLTGWLGAIQDTDPLSHYPLFAAARIYAEVPDPAKARQVLEFVHHEYLKSPHRRWPALAHGALLAKHRLQDLREEREREAPEQPRRQRRDRALADAHRLRRPRSNRPAAASRTV